MVRVTYIEATGERHVLELQPGESAMQAAVKQGLKGIDGECGGVLACGDVSCLRRAGLGGAAAADRGSGALDA